MNSIIEVVVAPDGKVRIETKGFTGESCRSASAFIERALGLRQSEKLTAEFYSEQITQKQEAQQ